MMWKQHRDFYVVSNWPSLFFKFFKNFFPFLRHFITHNRDCYEWFWRLRCHIQVGRLPLQSIWFGLIAQSIILGSVWPIGQTSNNSVINIKWWRCPFPSGPCLALTHPNSKLETHFVLILAKIIKYIVFQLSLSHWFIFIETYRQYFKNFGGAMERFPTKIIYGFYNKLLQINDWSFC